MPQPLNYQLSFGGEKIPEPAPVKKETIISGSTPDQIKLVSGIAQNWVTDYLKSENPDADVSSLGEIKYNPNLPVFDSAFPAINDQTDFKALGLEDENGNVTTKGEQYVELKDMGIITQFGGLSNHGKALLMSEDDALLPENIDIFRAREDIGMYKGEDVGVLKQIGDLSTELATGVQNIVVGAAQYGLGGLAQIGVLSDENKAADIAGGVAAIDAFTTGMAKLPMMSEGIVDSLVTLVATQMADSEDIAMVQAQHRQDVLRKASLQADYSFLEQVSPVIDFLVDPFERVQPVIGESVETARQTMGEANYGEFTQPIQAVSQFAPMLLKGPLVPLGLAIQPEMLAIHATQTGATKLWQLAASPVARAAFRAGETAKIIKQLEVDASILNAQKSIALTEAEKASNLSVSLSEKANSATFTGDVVGSKAAADVASQAATLAKMNTAYVEYVGGKINNVNEQIAKLQKAYGVADRTLKIADTFRKWPTVVGNVAGWPLEQIGKGLIATRKGVDAVSARTDKIGGMIRLADKVSGLGVGAVGSVFNPVLAVPAVAKVVGKGILALGPVIKGVGSFTRVMGEAASERAASIPFWQKVANFENLNPTQRMLANGFSEFAVAGGYLKRVGGNYAKTYPAFLGLEYLHSGDLETAAKNAIAPTIVIGAPGALLGSAITGSRSDLRNLAQQDMLNFRSRMPSEQRQKFDSMDSGVKKVIANVAESQPGVKFDFTDTGRGRFDENTYTVFINPNSRSPLRPVVMHEFLHYITEAGGATNSINHLLFGNEIGTGGLLKSVDGKYDKNYLKFKDEYIKLQEQDDAARRRNGQEVKAQTMDDAYLGMEYFVETQVDRLLRMSESGELSRLAGKTQLQRFASKKINELADSMMSRGAFLENLAMRMGSLRDNKGEYVMGNGILAEGVRDMPEMRNLFNKLISETSGRRPNATKSMDARSTSKSSQGREIPITDKNDPMIGSMYSDFVFDENNVVKRDQYGNPERISNDRKKSQESIGLSVADLQAKRIQSGESLLPGELRYDPQAKEWVGNYLTPEQVDVIRNSGFFEQPFLDSLDLVNGAAKRGLGEVVNLSYSAATKRNKKMGPSYFSGGVTLRQISPIEVRINKAGGIYVKSVDVLQLRANINEVARSKDGARVYEGDVVAIADDVNEVMKLHANDQPTDAYFAKYGAEAQTRKKLINSVFGKTLIDKGINEFSSSAPRSVLKDFRIDRFGKSVLKKGTDGVQVNHKFVRINYLPEGPLRSNTAGDVVVGNPELKAKIEERNRKLGLPPSDGFADTTKPADTTRYLPETKIEDGFYSQLESVISKKIPTRATPEQIMATIDPTRGSGIKADEIKWSGIEQALPKLAVDGKVTKEALLKYLADEGNVRFEEVTLSNINTQKEMRLRRFRESQQKFRENGIYVDISSTGEVLLRDKYSGPPNIDPNSLQGDLKKEFEILSDNASDDRVSERSEPLFSDRVLPGGENYREVVLAMPRQQPKPAQGLVTTLPDGYQIKENYRTGNVVQAFTVLTPDGQISANGGTRDSAIRNSLSQMNQKAKDEAKRAANYTSSHFPDIPNYVAHMRLDERTLGDGTRTLHSAEYQSDRHQAGRKSGYREDAKTAFTVTLGRNTAYGNFPTKEAAKAWIQEHIPNRADEAQIIPEIPSSQDGSVADAPFRTTWPLQLFKRQLRDAVEGGFDSVSWDVGKTQNDRYSLSKEIDSLKVTSYPIGNESYYDIIADKNGGQLVNKQEMSFNALAEYIGEELATKIANDRENIQGEYTKTYSGLNLEVEGKGMRGFYDTMLPKEIGKYVKQWGGKVEKSEIGQSMKKDEIDFYDLEDATPEELAQLEAEGMIKGDAVPIWRVDITPEMRKISETGQTRYLPEAVDADYMKAVESGDVEMQQKMVNNYIIKQVESKSEPSLTKAGGWLTPSGRWINTGRHAHQPAIPKGLSQAAFSKLGFVRVAQYDPLLVTEGYPLTNIQKRALKNAAIERGLEVRDETRDSFGGGKATVRMPDPVTRDDSGKVIPLSQRFNPTTSDIRYLPEGLPKNYQSNKDEGYLRSSIGIDGLINLYRPFKSTEALPTVSMRHDYPVQDFKIFNFDKKASVVYAKNKNGVDISFKFDPLLMNKPEFADFDTKYKGMVVQLAMADRHGATDGDMGGHSFPDLKVNQDNIVTDENGKEYKLVWSNNAWGPVANMTSKAQKFGAVTLLTYNMDPHAHDSNTRTVRIFSNEIANSGLSIKDQSTILIVQNVALKKFLTSASKSDLRALIKNKRELVSDLKIDDKIASGSKKYPKVERLSATDRETLLYEINDIELQIKDQEALLKEALGAKDATVEEMKVDKLFRAYQTKRRASEKTPKSEGKAKAMKDAEKELRDFQKTKEFKLAEKLLPSRELDQFSNTFNGRKSLIKAIKTSTAAVKWGSFDALKISEKIGDQMTGDSMHIVSSVELSSDPNFKAVYLGEDPKEIARMTPSEKLAADKYKSNPDFVSHEAYQWSMLGPAESKHYFNTNQRSVLDSFPSFLDEYSKFPVKEGKLKLNDPNSKASEFNKVNTIRDQSKIRIVYGGTNEKQQ